MSRTTRRADTGGGSLRAMNRKTVVISLWLVSILTLYLALLAYLRVFNIIPDAGNTHWVNPIFTALLSATAVVAGAVSVFTGVNLLRDPDNARHRQSAFVASTVVFNLAAFAIGLSVALVSY